MMIYASSTWMITKPYLKYTEYAEMYKCPYVKIQSPPMYEAVFELEKAVVERLVPPGR